MMIRSRAPEWAFRIYVKGAFELAPVNLDAGVVEAGILGIDREATLAAGLALVADSDAFVEREVRALREWRPDMIVFDIPPLAARVAAELGIPSLGISNFSWSFIYDHYAGEEVRFAPLAAHAREAEALTTRLFRLPLNEPMMAFPTHKSVPLIARLSFADRDAIRAGLNIAPHQRAVLIALRGEALPVLDALAGMDNFVLLSYGELAGGNVRQLSGRWQDLFTDVLAASDLVLSKPGYSIISECVANRRPLLHLPRAGFPEAPVLVKAMDGMLRHRALALEEATAEGFLSATEELLAQEEPAVVVCDGARVCAQLILEQS